MFNNVLNVILVINTLKISFIFYYLPHYQIAYNISDWLLELFFMATILFVRFGRTKLSTPVYQVISGTLALYVALIFTVGHLQS